MATRAASRALLPPPMMPTRPLASLLAVQVVGLEELDAREDALDIVAGQAQLLAAVGADGDVDGLVAVLPSGSSMVKSLPRAWSYLTLDVLVEQRVDLLLAAPRAAGGSPGWRRPACRPALASFSNTVTL